MKPTIDQLINDYQKVCEIMQNCRTVADARKIAAEQQVTIEVALYDHDPVDCNSSSLDNIRDEQIEWLRYDYYGCLEYIYFKPDGGQVTFDLIDEEYEPLVDGTTLGEAIKYLQTA